jgi:hypothetical protein|tara:strand:+ start:16378 stop:17388 length:1011 start_codon:yes stop_codon:yes gene_type:complete
MTEIPTLQDNDQKFLDNYDIYIDKHQSIIKRSNKVGLLLEHIKHNLNNISDRVRILRFKYSKYKWWYDCNNIIIIIISAILTLFSAITSQLQTEIDKNVGLQYATGIIPVVLAGIITLIASVMKFKKLQEKMEKISNLIEKSIIVMAKLKKTSEDLYFKKNDDGDNDDKNFEQLEATFLNETCDICNNCIMQMEQLIKDKDYKKYLKIIKINDDTLSQIIFHGKKGQLKQEIYHRGVEFDCKAIRNARTKKKYDIEMGKINKKKYEKEKEKKEEKEKKWKKMDKIFCCGKIYKKEEKEKNEVIEEKEEEKNRRSAITGHTKFLKKRKDVKIENINI